MARNKKSLRKRVIQSASSILLAQILIPFSQSLSISAFNHSTNNGGMDIRSTEIANLEDYAKDLTARDYLNLANGIAHSNRNEDSVCRHFTDATFEIYNELIGKSNRFDLKDSVRMAFGIKDNISLRSHSWIEVKEDDSWVPYETMLKTPILEIDDVNRYSEENKEIRSLLNGDFKMEHASFRSFPGSELTYCNIRGFSYAIPNAICTLGHEIRNRVKDFEGEK